MELILIGGVSGSGKSVALGALEDCGYYAVANLPLSLVAETADYLHRAAYDRVAVTFDLKTGAGLDGLPEAMTALRASGWDVRFLVLDAKTDTLVKRFSETRRRHPFSSEALTLTEAIEFERALLADVRDQGFVFDTSDLSAAALRMWIKDFVGMDASRLTVQFESFGFKHGVPRVRRAVPAEPSLRARACTAFGTRSSGHRLPRARSRRRPHVSGHPSLHCRLAARLRTRQSQLPDRRDRMHGRTASVGLLRRAACARIRGSLPGDAAPSRVMSFWSNAGR
jgi:hypothetical protein